MTDSGWRRVRLATAAVILGLLLWRLGSRPFVAGLRSVGWGSAAAAATITAATTAAAAWRWTVIARGLGLRLRYADAVIAYYRSQFLNSALPGGVLGDVHRGVRHGRTEGDVGHGLRAVFWDRVSGQVVQVALTVLVLASVRSPLRSVALTVLTGAALLVAVAVVALTASGRCGGARVDRLRRGADADVRAAFLTGRAWRPVTAASGVVVLGHAAVFLVAARAFGTDASLRTIAPVAALVLLAMTVPVSVGGWGPREGVAAWAFGAAGLGAAHGVSVATGYGVLALVATLPGAAVLLLDRSPHRPVPAPEPPAQVLVTAGRAADA